MSPNKIQTNPFKICFLAIMIYVINDLNLSISKSYQE